MKQPFLIHGIWAVVALIAFVLGSQHFSGDPVNAEDGDTAGKRGDRSSNWSQGPGESGRRAASRSNQHARNSNSAGSGSIHLSDKGIKQLGNILQTSNDPIERRIAFSKLLEGMTLENAEVLREQIIHMPSSSQEWKDFHYAWGALGGQSVVEFGAQSDKKDMAAAFSGWASADPQAALAWLGSQQPDQQNRHDLKWGAVYGLANENSEVATSYVMGRWENGDKDAGHMMSLVADTMMRKGDMTEATRWAATLPAGALQDEAVRKVAQGYAREDPAQAVAWLDSLPQSSAQAQGLWGAFSTWAGRDPEAAGKKLNTMSESPGRDSAISGYSRRIAYQQPRSAIDWASTITDPKTRNKALIYTVSMYMRRDREAARQWLAGSDLPAAMQKKILARGRGR